MATTQAQLAEEILAAKKAINNAEIELQKIVGNIEIVPRAQKIEVSGVVRAAFSRLEAARVRLVEVEKSVAGLQLETARKAIIEAEKNLEMAVDEIVGSASADKALVTCAVNDSFVQLKATKKKLVELKKSASRESDDEG